MFFLAYLLLASGAMEVPASAADAIVGSPESTDSSIHALRTIVTGYLDTRFTYQRVEVNRLLPPDDTPSLSNVVEGNLQLKLLWGETAFALADASFFYQWAGGYYRSLNGARVRAANHDVPAYRPFALINELYVSVDLNEWSNLTVGKKRIAWGPGLAVNPTDLLNPPKDPTDPSSQREGSWVARWEGTLRPFTLSLLAAAVGFRQYGGVPTSLLYQPSYPPPGAGGAAASDQPGPHYALVARAYALIAGTDLNLMYYFTHHYNDSFATKNRLGASASRMVSGSLELHVEALAQLGSTRIFLDSSCATSPYNLDSCRTKLESRSLFLKALAGARYTFPDDSMLAIEYYFNGDGYDAAEFSRFVTVASSMPLTDLVPAGSTAETGSPRKFTFAPLRKHYAFLTYLHPRIRNDFSLAAVLLLDLQDLSGQIAPSLTWNVRDSISTTLTAFIPLGGLHPLQTEVNGRRYSEFGLFPIGWRAMLSTRLSY